jgi:hypothetical protein
MRGLPIGWEQVSHVMMSRILDDQDASYHGSPTVPRATATDRHPSCESLVWSLHETCRCLHHFDLATHAKRPGRVKKEGGEPFSGVPSRAKPIYTHPNIAYKTAILLSPNSDKWS